MIIENSIYVGHDPYYLVCEPFYRKAPNQEHFIFFQSGGHTEPANNNTLFIVHSKDKGKTWTVPREIFSTPGKGTWSSEVFVDEDKITAFIYEVEQHNHFGTLKAFRAYSYDSGYTWTEREKFEGFHECCNMRQRIVLSDGTWVIPFCYTEKVTPAEVKFMPEREAKLPFWYNFYQNHIYRSGVLISRDKGQSFERFNVPADREQNFLWEPNCIELSNGDIVLLMRNEYNGWLWKSVSQDGGRTWSWAEQTEIPDPSVKMRLLKLKDNRIVLFCHPNKKILESTKWKEIYSRSERYPLEMWVSADDMKSWYKKVSLQEVTAARSEKNIDQYHYPDGYVDESDKKIYIAVDLNRNELVSFEIPFSELD